MYLCKITQPNLSILAIKMRDIFLFRSLVDLFLIVHSTKGKLFFHNKEAVLSNSHKPQNHKTLASYISEM